MRLHNLAVIVRYQTFLTFFLLFIFFLQNTVLVIVLVFEACIHCKFIDPKFFSVLV